MVLVQKVKKIASDFSLSWKTFGLRITLLALFDALFGKKSLFLLSPLDFMVPLDGVLTAGQILIVSRVIDYERIMEGKNTIWERRFSDLEGRTDWTDKEDNYYKLITSSLDKWGWDYNLSSVFINRSPAYVYNGTHRMAYSIKHNPFQVIPFKANYNGWIWSKMKGKEYWMEKGLSDEEYLLLEKKYNELLSDVDFSLFVVLPQSTFNHKISDDNIVFSSVMLATICKEIGPNPGISSSLYSLFHNHLNRKFIVLRCFVKKYHLEIDNNRIVMPYLRDYIKKYNTKDAYYTPTITEANELRILLSSLCVVEN